MITNNISTLKIHKLTQAQYERELAAGRIDENALYLTPDEEGGEDVTISAHNVDPTAHADIRTAINEKADKSEGTFFVEGSGTTDSTNKVSTWTGSSDRITEYYDGLAIRYKIGVAGQSTTTLNINGLGEKTVYRFGTTKLTTQFPVGSVINLIYHTDLNDGCWMCNDYDANTNTYQRVYETNKNIEYPITTRYNVTDGETYYAEYGRYTNGVTINPSTNTITATAFKGKLTGNADTATKATQDANGKVIASTYETKTDASAKITSHNTDTSAHADIREQINQLSSEIVDEIIVMTQDAYNALTKSDLQALYAQGVRLIAVETSSGTVTYTNLVPISTDTDGSIYNGTGYKDNTRLSSSGDVSSSAQAGSVTTGFMLWQSKGIIRIKGATFQMSSAEHYYVHFYSDSKQKISGIDDDALYGQTATNVNVSISYDEATGVTTIDFSNAKSGTELGEAAANAKYFRLNAKGKGADLIVTVNEEI